MYPSMRHYFFSDDPNINKNFDKFLTAANEILFLLSPPAVIIFN